MRTAAAAPEAGRNWLNIVALGLVLLILAPLLYALSVGPVVYLAMAARIPEHSLLMDGLVYFYAPLEWLSQNNELTKDFFDWYISFWDADGR